MRKQKGLASLILALVCLLSPSAFAKGKKERLLESARQTIGEVINGAAVVQGVSGMLGGGNEPKTVPTPDGGLMPNPRTMNLLIGQAVDLRDVSQTVQTWTDSYTRIRYQVYTIQRSLLNERVTSDFHAAFVKQGAWNTIGKSTSDTADRVVQDYTRNQRVDQSTIEGLKLPNLMGPQSLVIPEITFMAIEQAVEGNFERRARFEVVRATIILNIFMVDLETGITRQVAEGVEGSDTGFLASGLWSLFLNKKSGLTYVQQLTNKASQQAARKAAAFMAKNDKGPVRWADRDPVESIKGDLLNKVQYKVLDKNEEVDGDLDSIGQSAWILNFKDTKSIRKGQRFQIWTTVDQIEDRPTGVWLTVDRVIDARRVRASCTAIDPVVAGILPQAAPSGQGESQPSVRPSAQRPVEPQATVAEKFAQAEPGSMLSFVGKEPGEEFCGFYAQVLDCVPAKGEKKTTWLERGKVVLVVPPAGSKDQPVKGLVGDMEDEWVVWVLGDSAAANAVSEKVAWDGWKVYPYDPTQKGR